MKARGFQETTSILQHGHRSTAGLHWCNHVSLCSNLTMTVCWWRRHLL
jgi:hypothetical protein